MNLANIARGYPFRLALQLAAAFSLLLGLCGWLLVTAVSHSQQQDVMLQLEEETLLLGDIYRHQGRQGLVASIEQLAEHSRWLDRQFGLFDENHLHLAGGIRLLPDFVGFKRTKLSLQSADSEQHFQAKVTRLDKLQLVLGRSLQPVERTREQLIYWMLAIGSLLLVATLALGALASVKSYRKLACIGEVLTAVAAGQLKQRIPVASNGDQIDRVAAQINQQLERLASQVTSLQNTASAIAHDLKTPLSRVQIALYQSLEASSQEQRELQIDLALEQLDNLNTTFDTLLRISRLQQGLEQQAMACQSLDELVEKVFELMSPAAELQHTELLFEPCGIELHCDAGMLQQLLVNLINNCLCHCPPNSQFRIQAKRTESSVLLCCADNGPGVPEDQRQRLLEPFSRLSGSRTTPGNGLGLALVKAIVDHHGGGIQLLDNSPGLLVQIELPQGANSPSH